MFITKSVLAEAVKVILFCAERDVLFRAKLLRPLQLDVFAHFVNADEGWRGWERKLLLHTLCLVSLAQSARWEQCVWVDRLLGQVN